MLLGEGERRLDDLERKYFTGGGDLLLEKLQINRQLFHLFLELFVLLLQPVALRTINTIISTTCVDLITVRMLRLPPYATHPRMQMPTVSNVMLYEESTFIGHKVTDKSSLWVGKKLCPIQLTANSIVIDE